MALSSVQYKDSSGNIRPIDGYGVYVDLSSLGDKKYIIYADASPGNQQYDALTDYIVETIDFSATESGVIIKQLNNVPDTKVSINFNSSNVTTSITLLSWDSLFRPILISLFGSPPEILKMLNISRLFEVNAAIPTSIDVVFALESDLTKTKIVLINISGLVEVK